MGLVLPAAWLDWVPICGLLRLVCFAYLGKHKHRLYDSVPRVWFRIGVSLSSIRSIRLGDGLLAGGWDRRACSVVCLVMGRRLRVYGDGCRQGVGRIQTGLVLLSSDIDNVRETLSVMMVRFVPEGPERL
jgi:hypothetical protein